MLGNWEINPPPKPCWTKHRLQHQDPLSGASMVQGLWGGVMGEESQNEHQDSKFFTRTLNCSEMIHVVLKLEDQCLFFQENMFQLGFQLHMSFTCSPVDISPSGFLCRSSVELGFSFCPPEVYWPSTGTWMGTGMVSASAAGGWWCSQLMKLDVVMETTSECWLHM